MEAEGGSSLFGDGRGFSASSKMCDINRSYSLSAWLKIFLFDWFDLVPVALCQVLCTCRNSFQQIHGARISNQRLKVSSSYRPDQKHPCPGYPVFDAKTCWTCWRNWSRYLAWVGGMFCWYVCTYMHMMPLYWLIYEYLKGWTWAQGLERNPLMQWTCIYVCMYVSIAGPSGNTITRWTSKAPPSFESVYAHNL